MSKGAVPGDSLLTFELSDPKTFAQFISTVGETFLTVFFRFKRDRLIIAEYSEESNGSIYAELELDAYKMADGIDAHDVFVSPSAIGDAMRKMTTGIVYARLSKLRESGEQRLSFTGVNETRDVVKTSFVDCFQNSEQPPRMRFSIAYKACFRMKSDCLTNAITWFAKQTKGATTGHPSERVLRIAVERQGDDWWFCLHDYDDPDVSCRYKVCRNEDAPAGDGEAAPRPLSVLLKTRVLQSFTKFGGGVVHVVNVKLAEDSPVCLEYGVGHYGHVKLYLPPMKLAEAGAEEGEPGAPGPEPEGPAPAAPEAAADKGRTKKRARSVTATRRPRQSPTH